MKKILVSEPMLRQVLGMAAAEGWAQRERAMGPGAPQHEFTAQHRDAVVSEVLAAIDMAIQQAQAKPLKPSVTLYGPDGVTPAIVEG